MDSLGLEFGRIGVAHLHRVAKAVERSLEIGKRSPTRDFLGFGPTTRGQKASRLRLGMFHVKQFRGHTIEWLLRGVHGKPGLDSSDSIRSTFAPDLAHLMGCRSG